MPVRPTPLRIGLLLAMLAGIAGFVGPAAPKPAPPATWAEVERLQKEQKLEEASRSVELLLRAAEKRQDEAEWTKALVRAVQLRTALHGYETAVRFLKEEPWPKGLLPKTTLELFFGQALVNYARIYSWEIGQREKVESTGPLDLKVWTKEQILGEAGRAYADAWKTRAALGAYEVGALREYIQPNTYPAEVRGTLRDAISYLYGALLADTAFWTPQQSNDLYRLDVAGLLSSEGQGADAVVADPSVHPLQKLVAVLGDLEAWHAARGRRAAELEARLERLRRLHQALSQEPDSARIREDLVARLPRFRDVPWWSMGMAQLSEFVEAEDVADNRIRARQIALDGAKAYASSDGGRRCRDIARRIESPAFELASMASDGPDRRSIQVTHQSLSLLFFRAYPIELVRRIETAKDYNLLPAGREVMDLVRSSPAAKAWKTTLPPTPDYKSHRTFLMPPLRDPGLYVVAASAREDFAEAENKIVSVCLIVTDLVLVTAGESDRVETRVVSGDTGRPVAGAAVWLYTYGWDRGRHFRVASQTTDAAGVARFANEATFAKRSFFLVARKDRQTALDATGISLFERPTPVETDAALVYTDRSIYRPQQKILWKVVAYRGRQDLGRLRTAAEAPVTLTLRDANGEVVASQTGSTNAYGSLAGEFPVPAGRALGGWRIESSIPGAAFVQVEEYKRPTFEVQWKQPAEPLRLNRPAALRGDARYYFGLPVANGTVRWRVARTPQLPPWFWEFYRSVSPASGAEQTVAEGTAALGEDGAFEIRFTPQADERFAAGSKDVVYRYAATAEVTDEGGETRSADRAFRLGFTAVTADIRLEDGFLREERGGAVTVTRTDLDGAPRPGKGAWRLVAIVQPPETALPADLPPAGRAADARFATPGDALRARWQTSVPLEATLRAWPDGAEKARADAAHGANGEAAFSLPPLPEGAWRLRYETADEFGARYETTKDFLVGGSKAPARLAAGLVAERGSVSVGGTARFLAFSGLPDQPVFFEILRDGRPVEGRSRTLSPSDSSVIELPVTEADRGGFAARMWFMRDHQFVTETESILVPWDDKELVVSFATFRDTMRPGAKETWRVTVAAPPGSAGERTAELLAYMYDRSLDAFVLHNPPRPLTLYPVHASGGMKRSSLGESAGQFVFGSGFGQLPAEAPPLRPDRLEFFDGYGVGGPGTRRLFKAMAATSVSDAAAPIAEGVVGVEGGVEGGVPGSPQSQPMRVARNDVEEKPAAATAVLRSNFAETAFWKPQLLTGADGSAVIEFEVPDSVTSWNVWVHAITRDFASGSLHREARSVKDLMVRPYVPRFLREGDRAELKVVVNNASSRALSGRLALEILDTETNHSALAEFGLSPEAASQPFTVAASGGADLTFALSAPKRVGAYAIKATATAGDFSDGELRPVPVLPGRMQLAQSRFVALREGERRTMTFADMARGGDPSRIDEQLVVTIDAQLFYSVLNALPYLVNYPYECTEQTLNRFVSTGIVASLYRDYPAVAKMAEELGKRDTLLETWDAADPNRKMALEETPWLELAKGGKDAGAGLANVLDPRVAKAEREVALGRLRKAQTAIGAFPWWPGGPPSPYMTVYILYGLAKAAEFGVDVPKDMVQRGWKYTASHFRDAYARRMAAGECDVEWLTFLNYVASCYPDPSWMGDALKPDERAAILAFSFKHWKQHSPYLKGFLALTLKRMGRPKDAALVWASVMDSSKTDRDLGTYWAPEDRAWLWYEDTIETQAFALRTLMELDPSDARRHGLVQWLFLNKKLNQWKSTRATAEVIYSLVWYLKKEGALGTGESAAVETGGQKTVFSFDPDRYTGKRNQVVIPGEKIDPPRDSTIAVEKGGKGLAFASATWHFSTEKLPEEDRGDFFAVSRRYFRRDATAGGFVLKPLSEGASVKPGDEIEVQISLSAKHAAEYVHLRDPRAAGTEPENVLSRYKWDLGIAWYEETRDSGSNFFFEALPAGQYTFKYRVRANMAGTFKVGPATVQSMYAPEFAAYSSGATLSIH